jgi:hypothetical protein
MKEALKAHLPCPWLGSEGRRTNGCVAQGYAADGVYMVRNFIPRLDNGRLGVGVHVPISRSAGAVVVSVTCTPSKINRGRANGMRNRRGDLRALML